MAALSTRYQLQVPAAFATENSGLHKDLEVVAQRGLRHVELAGEVAEAGFLSLGPAEQADQLDTDGIAEGLEQAGGRRVEQCLVRTRHEQDPHNRLD